MKYRNTHGQNYIKIYCSLRKQQCDISGNTIEHNLCNKYLFKKEQKIKHTYKGS